PPADRDRRGLPLEVSGQETEFGPVWWRDSFYAGTATYGPTPLGSFLDIPGEVFAFLGQDERLGTLPAERLVFLDTETTGLAGGTGTVAFLVGLGLWRKNGLLIR